MINAKTAIMIAMITTTVEVIDIRNILRICFGYNEKSILLIVHHLYYIIPFQCVDCLDTIQTESRHRTNQIRQVTTASSLSDCGNRCRTLYFCRSVSFRYSYFLFTPQSVIGNKKTA